MQKKELVFIAVPILALSGCATNNKHNVTAWPWNDRTIMCTAEPCKSGEARKTFEQASRYCRNVQDYYEAGDLYANGGRLAIGTIGAVAGSVLAPLAKGSAATAWSGVSGVSNGLQNQMSEAFSSAVDIKRRAEIANAADEGADQFVEAEDNPDIQVIAAINMARRCAMGAAQADQAAMRAMVGAEPET